MEFHSAIKKSTYIKTTYLVQNEVFYKNKYIEANKSAISSFLLSNGLVSYVRVVKAVVFLTISADSCSQPDSTS
jgi:hypothetical protein